MPSIRRVRFASQHANHRSLTVPFNTQQWPDYATTTDKMTPSGITPGAPAGNF